MAVFESELTKEMYSSGAVGRYLGVSDQSVGNYIAAGALSATRTPGGHFRISREELMRFLDSKGLLVKDGEDRHDVIYARVSSTDQNKSGDLDRQVADLIRALDDYKSPEIITDVGSGLNGNRSGLKRLMKEVSENKVSRVVVYSKDRLTRFGFEYLDFFFESYGTTILYVEDGSDKNANQELVDDMMSLIASFSGRFYGLRSAKKRAAREVIEEVEDE